jgi:iron complex transport system ATP-binding protein
MEDSMRYTLAMRVPEASLLKIDKATVLRDGVKILDNVSLNIHEGQHTAIVGPNGS